jgi:nucleoid-associated protein YgaU
MKYAIAIGILIVGVGVWFFRLSPPANETQDSGLGLTDAAEPGTDLGAEEAVEPEPEEMVEITLGPEPEIAEPAAQKLPHIVASPPPIPGPGDEEQSDRPTGLDLSSTSETAETVGATEATEEAEPTGEIASDTAPVTEWTPMPPIDPAPETIDPAPEPAEEPAESNTHTIQPGDTFSKLAHQYYGDAKYARLISQANPDLDPRRLQVGAKIIIPEGPERTVRATPTESPVYDAQTIAKERRYVVQAGETWYDLGQKFLGSGLRGVELYELNKDRVPRDPNMLRAGTAIELPEGVDANQ